MLSKGHVIRAKHFQISGKKLFCELDHLESFAKKNIFRQFFDRATGAICELEYLRKLRNNAVFFCC